LIPEVNIECGSGEKDLREAGGGADFPIQFDPKPTNDAV
jgi:hypothetical protein